MYNDFRRQYYCKGMKRHVKDFFQRCLTYQQVKAKHQEASKATPAIGDSGVEVGAYRDGLCNSLAKEIVEA